MNEGRTLRLSELGLKWLLEDYDWKIIFNEYLEDCIDSIPGEQISTESFTIDDCNVIIMIRFGTGDSPFYEPWLLMTKLKDRRYAFISATTNYYTGFEIGGECKCIVSYDLETLIRLGMSEAQRQLVIEEDYASCESFFKALVMEVDRYIHGDKDADIQK